MKNITISEQIKIELSRKNITQAELSGKLGLTPAAISYKLRDNKWSKLEIYFLNNKHGFNIE